MHAHTHTPTHTHTHTHKPELSSNPSLSLVTVRRPEVEAEGAESPLLAAARGGTCAGESKPTFSCFFKSLANLAICRKGMVTYYHYECTIMAKKSGMTGDINFTDREM